MTSTKIERSFGDIIIHHRKDDVADLAVIREMFEQNVYELHGYKLEGDSPVVLDIGANIGTFTLLTLAVANEESKPVTIYAVEPEENNLRLLKKNIAANPLLFARGSKVIIIEKGLSDHTGTAKISNESGGSRVQYSGDYQNIELWTFDKFIRETQIDKVDFTKIDIEGSEVPLLRAASKKNLLRSHHYAIEFDRFNEVEGFVDILKPFMNDFSFRTWGIPANGCNVYFENHHWGEQ